MSHFTVLVPADSYDHLESVLLPYHEYECTGIEEYIEWVDMTSELKSDYANRLGDYVKFADGTLKSKYEDEFYVEEADPDAKTSWNRTKKKFVLPDNAELVKLSAKDAGLETFAEFADSWCGAKEIPGKPGCYGRLTNANAKWDWWEVGGRWTGILKLKPGYTSGCKHIGNGSPGLMTDANTDVSLFTHQK